MEFEKIVDYLLEKNERTRAWLARQVNRSAANLHYALARGNPQINLIKEIAEVFNMTEVEFIKLGEKLKKEK